MRNHPHSGDIMALDLLHHAQRHLAEQWRDGFTRPEAAANLEARALIWNAQNAILMEIGWPITQKELNERIQEARCAKI